ncbi:MAG: terminase gpA endonuclease subunit [Pseudomonadota bacterium]
MKSARAIICAALVAVIAPPPVVRPAEWAADNIVVPDGPYAGQKWDPTLAPYLIEPLNFMSFEADGNEGYVRKSVQTGFTMLALSAAGYMAVNEPCNGMIVQPTSGALHAFNKDKLGRMIEQSPAVNRVIKSQTSRSGDASTTTSKQYAGGSLGLAIATSTADLRSKTVKWMVKDECSDYPRDLDGQGSPHQMLEGRQEAFLASGEWKRLNISTPTIAGECEVSAGFERSDQRYWHVPCPGCGDKFHFVFDLTLFKFEDTYPHKAHYAAPCCGHIIEGHEKQRLIDQGEWIATAPGPGKPKGWHADTLISPLVPWDEVAARWIKAKDDPTAMKAFTNLTLGHAYEVSGDAPDHERLFERRDKNFRKGNVPAGGVVLLGAADVGGHGINYEIKAYGPRGQKFIVEADFLEGDTSQHDAGAFLKLAEVYDRQFTFANGAQRQVEQFGIDSGYRTHIVYSWCRSRVRAKALKGKDGWGLQALGAASKVDIDLAGKRIRKGASVHLVGTWPLKAAHYEGLRKRPVSDGGLPGGYTNFCWDLDEEYFRQITGEYLAEEVFRGRPRQVWKPVPGKQNHWLDCTIYNDALAHWLKLDRLDEAGWAAIADEFGLSVPAAISEDGLLAPDVARAVERQIEPPAPATQEPKLVTRSRQPSGLRRPSISRT